jgi:molybdopterin converting factor small subunit
LIYSRPECYNFFVQAILPEAMCPTFPRSDNFHMSVKINVYYFLPHLTNDQEIVEVEGNTVGECLGDFVKKFPGAREWLFEDDGELRKYLDIFVNLVETDPDDLSTPVSDGDEIHIVMHLTGG